MKPEIVKRNYLFFILRLLKEKTSEEGDHLTAEEIATEMKGRYGLEPNRKTIYTVISDLTAMGFDVHLIKNGKRPGYYLGKRELSETEMGLLIDGIESLDNLTADEKTDIYEKLCDVIGYPSEKVDNYLYARKEMTNEWLGEEGDSYPETESTMAMLDTINEAIKTNRKADLRFLFLNLKTFLMEEMDDGTAKRFDDTMITGSYPVSPYKLFRNANNEICLLFCVSFEGKDYPGFVRVTAIDGIALRKEKRAEVDEAALFPDDLANYESARDYRIAQDPCEADLVGKGMALSAIDFEFIIDECKKAEEVVRNGQPTLHITYAKGKEKLIESLILEAMPHILPLPGSRIYDRLQKLKLGLNDLFS